MTAARRSPLVLACLVLLGLLALTAAGVQGATVQAATEHTVHGRADLKELLAANGWQFSQAPQRHITIRVEQTVAEKAWLAKPVHTQEEKQAFLTAFQLATAISESIDDQYEASLGPGHSFLEHWGMSEVESEALAQQELNEWEAEAKLSHHSFTEVASLHHTEVEAELMASFGTYSESELDASLATEVEWPGWVDNAVNKAKEVSAAVGNKVNDGIQMANKAVNFVGDKLDQAEAMTAGALKKVTKATHTEFLNGAIDAGVSAAFSAGPLGQFKAIKAGINTVAAVSQGFKDGGVAGAVNAGKGALINAAKNYVMNAIPGGKILSHAMSGPLGNLVKKGGAAMMDSPLGKSLIAKSQKLLTSKVMQSPLAKALVNKVQEKAGAIMEKGKSMALQYVNDKIQAKTGLNLNLAQGGKFKVPKGKDGKIDRKALMKNMAKAGKGAAKDIAKDAAKQTMETLREKGQATLDAQAVAAGEKVHGSTADGLSQAAGALKEGFAKGGVKGALKNMAKAGLDAAKEHVKGQLKEKANEVLGDLKNKAKDKVKGLIAKAREKLFGKKKSPKGKKGAKKGKKGKKKAKKGKKGKKKAKKGKKAKKKKKAKKSKKKKKAKKPKKKKAKKPKKKKAKKKAKKPKKKKAKKPKKKAKKAKKKKPAKKKKKAAKKKPKKKAAKKKPKKKAKKAKKKKAKKPKKKAKKAKKKKPAKKKKKPAKKKPKKKPAKKKPAKKKRFLL